MKPFVSQRQAEFAGLKGDDDGRQNMLHEAHRLYLSMAAHGYAARLETMLGEHEKVMRTED
jgi:hypothetical protein